VRVTLETVAAIDPCDPKPREATGVLILHPLQRVRGIESEW
jgi:hypothetical protein